MTTTSPDQHVALLIDADNVQSHFEQILKIAQHYGDLKECRAYRDWKQYPPTAPCEEITYVSVDGGENATDQHLMMDACEFLGADSPETKVDLFVIVSGDGDFTALCERIKARGRQVIGIGGRGNSATKLRGTCDNFFFLDNLEYELRRLENPDYMSPGEVRGFLHLMFYSYHQLTTTGDWVYFNQLDKKLHVLEPDYETKFGKYPLSEWLRCVNNEFECNENGIRTIASRPSAAQPLPKVAPTPTPQPPPKVAPTPTPQPKPGKTGSDPDAVRKALLRNAFAHLRQPDGRVHLSKLVHTVGTLPNYARNFGQQKPITWLRTYKDIFKIHEDYVSLK